MIDPKLACELLKQVEEDDEAWRYPWMKDVCKLCLEYLSLEGLKDAHMARAIPEEILDVTESLLFE